MPIGLPKVPCPSPIPEKKKNEDEDEDEDQDQGQDEDEEIEEEWTDIYNRLYEERILILGSEITSENANILLGALIYFSTADPSIEFKFFINSPGGSVIDGIALYDTIDTLVAPVETTAAGVAASMACFILIAGTSRTAFPHARVMMHQPSTSLSLSLPEMRIPHCVVEVQILQKIRDSIIDGYRKRTLKSRTEIMRALERDVFFSAIEAKEYRLIDDILEENGHDILEENGHEFP